MLRSEWVIVGWAIMLLLGVEVLQKRMSVRDSLARLPFWVRWPLYYAAVYCIIRYGRFGH